MYHDPKRAGKMIFEQTSLFGHNRCTLQDIPKLSNIPGPIVVHEPFQRSLVQLADPAIILAIHVAQNGVRESRYILLPMTQGRQMDVKYVEPVIEIFPEKLLFE